MQSLIEKDREIQGSVHKIFDGESNVDISEDESEKSLESSDEDKVCDVRHVNIEWKREFSGLNLPAFVEENGINHALNPDARPIDCFFQLP